ncbi:Oxidoreductase molybdopterin binding domain protein [Falsiruegeria litorea R37]|uniref:Oxidoreductase molybdopterin binding domain protein n=1 Tax=Falsiruegeria litorea R37 TaxID=1200284 RepID=A0A1Y5TGD0_9RHOB|nr:molybdopterin-dependent oxidoreductase [Falsiruegeria litorea]SLN63234.1 Oxidoreductase molybdopterin binding domain protein [Falsiruegeria litorea R37]
MTSFTKIVALFLLLHLAKVASAGEVVLTVSGDVTRAEQSQDWTFDMDALRALPATTVKTTTIWTEGEQSFTGVSLAILLEHVGAAKGTIQAVALNDYAVKIPTTDAIEDGPVVAYSLNGSEMSVRDRGPLWIIYPFDENETYKSEEYYSRSIWQLDRIKVVAQE